MGMRSHTVPLRPFVLHVMAFSLLLVKDTGWAAERQVTGVLISDESGVSAQGTGTLRVLSRNKIYEFFYQKPYPQSFAEPGCRELGARWTVRFKSRSGSSVGLQIVSASCTGESDESVRSGVALVLQYLDHLAKAQYPEAYNLLGKSLRSRQSYEAFLLEVRKLNLENYQLFGTRCLEILSRSSAKHYDSCRTGVLHRQGRRGRRTSI